MKRSTSKLFYNTLLSSVIIQIVTGLPKTRSGKIMRRILRKVASGETDGFGDVSTLLNPEIVEEIKDGAV
jgi:acetyl-CoA synthetase